MTLHCIDLRNQLQPQLVGLDGRRKSGQSAPRVDDVMMDLISWHPESCAMFASLSPRWCIRRSALWSVRVCSYVSRSDLQTKWTLQDPRKHTRKSGTSGVDTLLRSIRDRLRSIPLSGGSKPYQSQVRNDNLFRSHRI